ncbi:MAG: glycosyltransferase family 2 protein [Actinomycetota bacterium]
MSEPSAAVATAATPSTGRPAPARQMPTGDGGEAPPVVAVVVASNPGEQFAEMLQSLGDQDYDNLSVLVIDAGSDEPIADRVAEVLPEAYLHRLTGDPGWSVAANQSIELVTGSPFLLFCHDDVALDEKCVSTLMGELYRRNAGIAAPKLVSWDDHRKLLQLGMGTDRFGVPVPQVDRGEFDQGQYEAVRDVFVAPGAVQLIRADLFIALGGFDPSITLMGEDVDLCWRAHAVGARVLAVSGAMARHRESMEERLPLRDRRKLATRHRLRTVLITATGRSRFTTVPMATALILLEALYYLLSGRRGQARDTFSAIGWNLTRLGDIRRRRRALRQIRQRSEREVRSLQVGGSAAVASFSRGQFTAGQDRFSGFLGAVRSSFQGEDSGSLRDATVLGMAIVLIVGFGSRHLLTRGIVPVGQVPIVPGASVLFNEFFGGWRSAGTGGPGNPPSGLLLLALGRSLFFWAPSLFEKLLVVGPLVLGPFGAFRLTRPLGSARSAAVATTFYAFTPLITSSFSAGRWESLVIYAAAPFLLGSLLRIDKVAPYGARLGQPAVRVAARSLPVLTIRFGILVAIVAAFTPSVIVLAVIMALVVGATASLSQASNRMTGYGLAAAFAVIAPVALHLPWSYDVMRSLSWRWVVGPPSPEVGGLTMLDLLQFAPGGPSPSVLSLGLVAVALIALAVATRPMLGFALQGWAIALVAVGLLWAEGRGWVPFALPGAESLLAVALTGLVLNVAIGVRALEQHAGEAARVPYRLANVAVGFGLLLGSVGGLLMSFEGQWDAPTQNYAEFTEFLAEATDGESRVLWIGDASVVPVDVSVSRSGLQYAITTGGTPEVWGRWSAGPIGRTNGVGEQLDLARRGETVRLGRLLAPYGISLVVVVDQLAPAPYDGPRVDPGAGVVGSLGQQLDLERVPGVPNLIVFRNDSSSGVAAALPTAEAAQAVTSADQLDVDLGGGPQIPLAETGSGQWSVSAPDNASVLLAVPNAGLSLNGQADQLISGFDGLTVIPGAVSGDVQIAYPVPIMRRLALLLQVVLVMVGAVLAQTRREVQL